MLKIHLDRKALFKIKPVIAVRHKMTLVQKSTLLAD
jgi:hypothetical protein